MRSLVCAVVLFFTLPEEGAAAEAEVGQLKAWVVPRWSNRPSYDDGEELDVQKLDFLLLHTPVARIKSRPPTRASTRRLLGGGGGEGGRGDVIKKYFTLRVPSTDTRSCLSDPKMDPNFGR